MASGQNGRYAYGLDGPDRRIIAALKTTAQEAILLNEPEVRRAVDCQQRIRRAQTYERPGERELRPLDAVRENRDGQGQNERDDDKGAHGYRSLDVVS